LAQESDAVFIELNLVEIIHAAIHGHGEIGLLNFAASEICREIRRCGGQIEFEMFAALLFRNIQVQPTEEARAAAYTIPSYEDQYYSPDFGQATGPAVPLDDYGYSDYR